MQVRITNWNYKYKLIKSQNQNYKYNLFYLIDPDVSRIEGNRRTTLLSFSWESSSSFSSAIFQEFFSGKLTTTTTETVKTIEITILAGITNTASVTTKTITKATPRATKNVN